MLQNTPKVPLQSHDTINHILQELGIPLYRLGYTQLCIAISLYAQNTTQAVCKELYPTIAKILGTPDWRSVEHAIRVVILVAWEHRDPIVWEKYFPKYQRAPSNKQFIATLTESIKQ